MRNILTIFFFAYICSFQQIRAVYPSSNICEDIGKTNQLNTEAIISRYFENECYYKLLEEGLLFKKSFTLPYLTPTNINKFIYLGNRFSYQFYNKFPTNIYPELRAFYDDYSLKMNIYRKNHPGSYQKDFQHFDKEKNSGSTP